MRPRTVSMTWVTGLFRVNAASQLGRVSAETSAVLPKVSGNVARKPTPWTAPAERTVSPIQTNTQDRHIAKPIATTTARAAAANPWVVRKPRAAVKTSSTPIAVANRTTSATTAPTRGAERAIGRLRNLSKTPLAMSLLSATPMPPVANIRVCTRMPGTR